MSVHKQAETSQINKRSQLTAAHIIKAGEQARIPVPHCLRLLDNSSWLRCHYLRHVDMKSLCNL